jgi:hypothetical protein
MCYNIREKRRDDLFGGGELAMENRIVSIVDDDSIFGRMLLWIICWVYDTRMKVSFGGVIIQMEIAV